ncbi:MAG: aminopeptidase P N-terminal domain-containing protein [Pseudomonadota bacterium]
MAKGLAITRREFARRRERLVEALDERSIVIVPSAPRSVRNRDIEYPYRPDSDFYYLTGFSEPDAVAVLVPGRPLGEFLLFCRERDAITDQWDGAVVGLDGASSHYRADDAFPIGDLDDILPGLMEGRERVYCPLGRYADFDQKLMAIVSRIRARNASHTAPAEVVALDHLLHEMRLFKSSAELRLIRHAAAISVLAHERAMTRCHPGRMEFELAAELGYVFTACGATASAYPSIVAGGRNGCVLHYTAKSAPLKDGDLVLVDAGAEYGFYAADVTRTYPINGEFSNNQRALYSLVLEAQLAAIDAVRAGVTWEHPHQVAANILVEGLASLGIGQRSSKGVNLKSMARFFIQPTGHWLGLDVHDVGDYRLSGEPRLLEPGMVFTIEPGVYIPPDDQRVSASWRGLSVRIEDMVVVTRTGCEVLSADAPKSVSELEAIVGSASAEGWL